MNGPATEPQFPPDAIRALAELRMTRTRLGTSDPTASEGA